MAKQKFAYENFFTTGTVTATSEAVGFAKENAYDWNTYDFWKAFAAGEVFLTVDMGSSQPANYWAISAHNLSNNSGTVQLQYSNDNFVSDINDAGALTTPTDNTTMFVTFDDGAGADITARYWRLKINSTTLPSTLGAVGIGTTLDMDRAVRTGATLPSEARNDKYVNQVSEGGQFLGRSLIRQGVKFDVTFTIQSLSFVRGNWSAFLDHAQQKPFWYSWNPDYTDAVYVWTEGMPRAPKFDRNNTLSLNLKLMGIY